MYSPRGEYIQYTNKNLRVYFEVYFYIFLLRVYCYLIPMKIYQEYISFDIKYNIAKEEGCFGQRRGVLPTD